MKHPKVINENELCQALNEIPQDLRGDGLDPGSYHFLSVMTSLCSILNGTKDHFFRVLTGRIDYI
jgi:hypothetical protein